MKGETLSFVRTNTGLAVWGAWRERIIVANALIEDPGEGRQVWREGNVLRIRVANGQAAYRIVEEDPDTLVCELAYAERDA